MSAMMPLPTWKLVSGLYDFEGCLYPARVSCLSPRESGH